MKHGSHINGAQPGVLITGASGYLGRLIAVTLLRHEQVSLVLPVRDHHSSESVVERIAREMEAQGEPLTEAHRRRLHIATLDESAGFAALDAVVGDHAVREVVHAAACLDYFDAEALEEINIGLTQRLLERCHTWNIDRFTYISTAFSAGYVGHAIAEALPAEPDRDPTEYTRTKRRAEHLVADSGLPFLCLRPSVVIGDSRDGHYTGKQYGLYQLWAGIERFLCREWAAEMHVVAGTGPMQFIHQDAFQTAFLAAWRKLPANSFLNIVSSTDTAPTQQDLWGLWFRHCLLPEHVSFYQHIDDIPPGRMSRPVRALMALGSVNLDIAAHPWSWETGNLERLFPDMDEYPSATLESIWQCQRAFMASSQRVRVFIDEMNRSGRSDRRLTPPLNLQPVGAIEGASN